MAENDENIENPEEGEKKEAIARASAAKSEENDKISTFRELIIGPEKKELENQLVGMRELFTSILRENKRDYDAQLRDMKELFVSILEESRSNFQLQLQELYDTLPNMINSNTAGRGMASGNEQHLFLADTDEELNATNIARYSKINAVKEIILGGNIEELSSLLETLMRKSRANFEEGNRSILSMSEEVSKLLTHVEASISQKMNEVAVEMGRKIKAHDEKQSQKTKAASLLQEAGLKM